MNFTHMPELSALYAYFILIGVCILIVAVEIWYFKRKAGLTTDDYPADYTQLKNFMNTLPVSRHLTAFPVFSRRRSQRLRRSPSTAVFTRTFSILMTQLLKEKADAASERCEIVLLFRHQRKTDTPAVQICVSASAGGVQK